MIITEYRIPLPLTVEEYQIGQLYTTIEMSREETGGGEGVEILKNEPYYDYPLLKDSFKDGQYTYKIYHMAKKFPSFIRYLIPQGALEVHEEAWNSYPYCRTELKNPGYIPCFMKDGFSVTINSYHCNDGGEQENVHCLSPELLRRRNVVYIDIANDPVLPKNYKPEYDPTRFKSIKTGRGPFVGNWIQETKPIMTCYKLVTAEFKWFGLQTRVENLIHSAERKIFLLFNRMLVCSMDKWCKLRMDEIRNLEIDAAVELHKKRFTGQVTGMIATDE